MHSITESITVAGNPSAPLLSVTNITEKLSYRAPKRKYICYSHKSVTINKSLSPFTSNSVLSEWNYAHLITRVILILNISNKIWP